MTEKVTKAELLATAAVAMYYLGLILVNQAEGTLVTLLWYGIVFVGAITGIYCARFQLSEFRSLFLILMIITGGLNICFIGTTNIIKQGLLVMLFLLSLLFTSKYVDEKVFLGATLANVLVIAYKFATVGLYGEIFAGASTNYVSVQLLYPAAVYYIMLERDKKKITLWPAAVVWVMCLLSRGRGGIIASTLFFLGLFIVVYRDSMKSIKKIGSCVLIAGIAAIVLNIESILLRFNNSVITEYFRDRGLRSSRTVIWQDYWSKGSDTIKELIFGADISDMIAWYRFEGNPHNSFINIHMNNGIIMMILVALILIRCVLVAYRTRKYVFCVCALSLIVRAFTDNVFWPSYGTAIYFFLMFYDVSSTDSMDVHKRITVRLTE